MLMLCLALSLLPASRAAGVPLRFTLKQQEVLSQNLKLYRYFEHLSLEGMTPSQIEKKFNLTPDSTRKYLAQLEQLELLKNGSQLPISGNVHQWGANEPMGKAYNEHLLDELVARSRRGGVHPALAGYFLTDAEQKHLQDEYEALKRKYVELSVQNRAKKPPGAAKRYATAFLLGEDHEDFFPEPDSRL